MASISAEPNCRKCVQFVGVDGKRRTIRLGKVSVRQAEAVKVRVERLAAAQVTGHPPDDETGRWLQTIDGELRERLERVGLAESRKHAHPTLGTLFDEFFASIEVKVGTATTYGQTRRSLAAHFGNAKRVREVDPLEAEKWRQSMKAEGLAAATISKRVKTARQMFRHAVRWKMITDNPFDHLIAGPQTNKARQYFLSREDTQRVLDQCPDAEWRLIVALSRYGGLRCPSEHVLLRWQDINWEAGRILVRSPKTERYAGGESRLIPLFPELRATLLEVFGEAADGAEFVITRYRQGNQNLRTQFERITARAGLKPWPKLFHNLRATRQTELEELFPSHVVCGWLGNSEIVARKHYLQTTDNHLEKAVQNPVQHPAADARNSRQTLTPQMQNPPALPGDSEACERVQDAPMTLTGFEPVSRP